MWKKVKPFLIVMVAMVFVVTIFLQLAGDYIDDSVDAQLQSAVVTQPTAEQEDAQVADFLPVIDWDALLAQNPDIVGWIYVDVGDDEVISYPIAYRDGDREYYLTHGIDGTYSQYGVPYIPGDYNYPDTNVFSIHGHNFHSGENVMFSLLERYADFDFYEAHPTFWWGTAEEGFTEYEIFSVVHYDVAALNAGEDCWNYLDTSLTDTAEYAAWLEDAVSASLYDTGVVPGTYDDVIILSTCDNKSGGTGRYVILAREVR